MMMRMSWMIRMVMMMKIVMINVDIIQMTVLQIPFRHFNWQEKWRLSIIWQSQARNALWLTGIFLIFYRKEYGALQLLTIHGG